MKKFLALMIMVCMMLTAVAFGEALKPEFKAYQEQIAKNAQAFCKALIEEGFDVVSGGTDNHLILLDLRPFGITGKDYEIHLDEVHITANKNAIPNDPQKPGITSGVRIGTPVVTTRGFVASEMEEIVECIDLVCADYEANRAKVIDKVAGLIEKHPIY